ncbi:MAG: NrfD/PsrC family molybdoenzyme membrane anchor subunit [Candidatus Bathyarchaeia archaeon]|nr:polysulfide reductase NrfD [Candidatus Bathyarchaeota archaeon]
MSEPVWGILIAAYLFLGGMAGGAYVIGAWSDLFGKDRYKVLAKSGVYTSLISILAGLIFLILDLKRLTVAPFSVLNAYIHFPVSIMSVGTWIISAFTIISLSTTIIWLMNGNRLLRKFLEILGIVLGFSTTAYTGILLSYARGRPFWSSPFLPWLFTVSGILTGLGLAVVGIPIIAKIMPRLDRSFPEFFEQRSEVSQMFKSIEEYSIVPTLLEIIVVALFIGTVWSTNGSFALILGNLSTLFWMYLVIGLLVHLALSLYSHIKSVEENTIVFGSLVSFILVLIGGFILRYVVLIAGQL